MTERPVDVVVVGAGVVGASCAYFAARAGLSVAVVDRGTAGSGTTSRGEGNVLVSDKGPGPELELALWSRELWLEIGDDVGASRIELEHKGGLVVATSAEALPALHDFGRAQTEHGVDAQVVEAAALTDVEPALATDLPGGVLYPQDLQVQPILAAATLLHAARARGARLYLGSELRGVEHDKAGRVAAVLTDRDRIPAAGVVNAAGTWGGEVGRLLGAEVPVLPRRGFVLVTEPLPPVIRRKVYSADYVANVASDDAGLETSAVIEGTRGGTVLIGASRERVGFDATFSVPVVRRLAAQAVRLFPMLAGVSLMRVYQGFRPYCPDHLPVIGPDERAPGVVHACGHEGAGVGLAAATGRLVTDLLTGANPRVSAEPFAPARFAEAMA